MSQRILRIKNLSVEFRSYDQPVPAVTDFSMDVFAGETVGLVGESGCGKSTAALAIMGLLDPDNSRIKSGSIFLGDLDLTKLSRKELRKIRGRDIAMIFQEPMTSLNPVYTVGRQLTEGIILHQGLSKEKAAELAALMLKKVNIPSPQAMLRRYPFELSGGMRQRVMIAMALSCTPRLLIADEPTTALDVTVQAQILNLMNSLKESMKMAIILITHDLGVVAEMCKYVYVMYSGQIVETSGIDELLSNPLHPYTQGLLNSMPEKYSGREKLYCIPGTVPFPGSVIRGCRFAERCPYKTQNCLAEEPPLIRLDEHTSVRCFRYQGNERE